MTAIATRPASLSKRLSSRSCALLDMTYVATRLRANQTGGEEVGLIFESNRPVLSRWQVQCRNTPRVSLDDVAKEVGLTHLFKSNVVVIVTTGEICSEARRYANKIMAGSSLTVVMINGGDLKAIGDRPSAIVHALDREAHHAMELKKFDLPGKLHELKGSRSPTVPHKTRLVAPGRQ